MPIETERFHRDELENFDRHSSCQIVLFEKGDEMKTNVGRQRTCEARVPVLIGGPSCERLERKASAIRMPWIRDVVFKADVDVGDLNLGERESEGVKTKKTRQDSGQACELRKRYAWFIGS